MTRASKTAALLAGLLTLHAGVARADWTLTPLKPSKLGPVYPVGISAKSVVLGVLEPTAGGLRGAVMKTAALKVFDACGTGPGTYTAPVAIDNFGDDVGLCNTGWYWRTPAGPTSIAAFADASTTTPVGTQNGLVAGNVQLNTPPFDGSTGAYGFTFNTAISVYQLIMYPNSTQTKVNGVSTGSAVFGTYILAGVQHGFFETDNIFTSLDLPGYTKLTPTGMNVHGQVAGTVLDAHNGQHAFSWTSGVFKIFQPQGHIFSSAVGINDKGRVAGFSLTTSDAAVRAMRWTPKTGTISSFPLPIGFSTGGLAGISASGNIAGYYQLGSTVSAFLASCSGTGC